MIKSLRLRLSLLLIVVMSAILGGFEFYGHRELVGELNQNFYSMQEGSADRIAQSLAAPLMGFNPEALDNILRAQLASPDMVALQVVDPAGKVIAGLRKDANGNIVTGKELMTLTPLTLKKPVIQPNKPSEPAGLLLIQYTRDKLDGTIARNLQRLIVQILVIDSVLILLFLTSLREIFGPLAELRDALLKLATRNGNDQVAMTELPENGDTELAEVARGFNLTLRKISDESGKQQLVLSGKANAGELSQRLQDADDFANFGDRLLEFLVPWVGADVAAFYVSDDGGQSFGCVAGRGISPANCRKFRADEGLIAEAMSTRQPVVFRDIPDDLLRIDAGLLSIVPRTMTVVPVFGTSGALAAIELGYLHDPKYQSEVLSEALPVIAFSLQLLISKRATLRELRERVEIEERTRLIIGAVNDGIVGLDNDGVVTFSNPSAWSMLGFSMDEFIGQPLHELVHHHYADGRLFPREECAMVQTAQDGKPRTVASEVLWRKDGSFIPVEYLTTPVLKNGTLVGSVVVYRDITERKKAEEEIRHINFLSDQALGMTKAGYWHVPLDGSGLYNSSERAVRIFGDPPNENYRYRIMEEWVANIEAADPESARATQKNFEDAINGTAPAYDSIYPYKRPVDGRIVWIHAYGTVHHDANGKATDMFGVTQDVTEIILAQQELVKAKAIAEEATRAKSDFLANMSHEIRTPMNSIIGMSHLALQTNLEKKQRNYIEKVHRAGENLLGIINDILDFSKIESGKMHMEVTDFRLEDVLEHLANLIGLKAEDKGLELLFNTAPDLPTALTGDPLRLGQILVNLGNNAVKFTDRGEIIVGAEIVEQSLTDITLHFWVQDSGIGIAPDQLGKMFQSFSQADASTTRKYGGTGLGLAISKSLVEAMHGKIWVESELGQGSTFHFHVRLGLQKEPVQRRMFRAAELQGVRVLVVDDNASAREILATQAKTFGLEVEVATDGFEGLRMLAEAEQKERPFDLVLMDWKMPGIDGIETIRRIHEENLAKAPAVIMVTAYGRDEAMGSAEQRGIVIKTALTKPVTPSTLLEAIGDALGKGDLVETRKDEKIDANVDAMNHLRGARVLLAEDNEMNQELAVELLHQAGMDVVVANNGQEAVDLLTKDPHFDGVLMDCQMPVMDGYTATREIRKIPAFKELPIIAVTANAMAGDREKVLAAGMVDHIAKPFNIGEMFATIAKWISPHAKGGPAPTIPAATLPDPSVENGLPALPGIDTRAGLATAIGDPRLYERMLVKFRDSQRHFTELFAAAKVDPDPEAATRAAHTLKGTAANIGAGPLQSAAAELELACREDASAAQIDVLLKKVASELAAILPGLDNIGTGSATTDDASREPVLSASQRADINALLDKLHELLASSEAEAGEVIGELLEKCAGSSLAKHLRPVASSIEKFDYDEALAQLAEARQ